MKQVFISYVRENADIVDRFYQELKSRGIEVWLDRYAIDPGARWKTEIRRAIHQGTLFIACFSKEYSRREQTHMNAELTIAIEVLCQFHADRIWFIPVKLNECEIPDIDISRSETLRDLQSVALYENWNHGIQRILNVIQRKFSSDSEADSEVSLPFVEELQNQADVTSDNAENERQAESLFQQGNDWMMSGQLDKAIAAYSHAIAVNPHHARAYHYLASAYERKDEFDKAIATYSTGINVKKKDYAAAYCNRGGAYFKKGEFSRAKADCNKAIDMDVDFAGAYYLRGIIHGRENRQDDAFNDFDKAVSLKPDFAEAYYNRGVSYLRRHEFDRALNDFDRATELKQDFAEAVRARALIHQRLQEQTQP